MRWEMTIFIGMIGVGIFSKKMEWRRTFFLLLFVALWVFVNWKKG